MKTMKIKVKKNRAEFVVDAISKAAKKCNVDFNYEIKEAPNSHQARKVCVWLDGDYRTSILPVPGARGSIISGSSLTKLREKVSTWFEKKCNVELIWMEG
jgi:hypothetical protein